VNYRLLTTVFLSLALTACAPQATIVEPDDEALRFIVLPRGDLAVIAYKDANHGDVRVAGPGLQIDSPYCQPVTCSPSANGFIRLTYPDDGKDYGSRLEIEVTAGTPEVGRAVFTLEGEEASREALLQPQD
jgi:hypothetical protein